MTRFARETSTEHGLVDSFGQLLTRWRLDGHIYGLFRNQVRQCCDIRVEDQLRRRATLPAYYEL